MNEVEEEKQLLGSRLFDQIDAGLHSFGQAVASAAEDKEGWTDDAVRGTLGTLQWIGNLPVLKQLGQLEEGIVGGVRNLAERQDFIDPRAFTYTTRVGTAFIPYGGAVKALSKTKKLGTISKAAKVANKFDSLGATDDLIRQQAGLKMRLLQRIDATDLPDNNAAMWATIDKAKQQNIMLNTYYRKRSIVNKALTQPRTKSRGLSLYGANPDMFEEVPDLFSTLSMPDVRGGRFVKVGDDYFTVFTRGGKQQILPYNKWYSRNVNPFMVPKQLLTKLKKFEAGQQGDLLKVSEKNPLGVPTIKVPYGTKGKFREVVPPTKYPRGTVNEFNNWYKDIFKLQKEEQALNRQVSEMLERLGNIEARNPGKKVFDTDLSHIAPRSKGGSGLTFQEAWILNQQRGATDILDDAVLAAAGIPKNWEELFYFWLAQKKPGKELQTAIGPLSQINVDDYFALSKGEPLNIVGKRRQDIRHLINRQIGNKQTYRLPGKRGTIQDDFEAAVRASKAGQVGGDIFLNDKLLDLRWVAKNYDDLIEIGDI